MQAYQLRVMEENRTLDENILLLKRFVANNESLQFDGLPEVERQLLKKQLAIMEQYSDVLGERIDVWNIAPTDKTIEEATKEHTALYERDALQRKGINHLQEIKQWLKNNAPKNATLVDAPICVQTLAKFVLEVETELQQKDSLIKKGVPIGSCDYCHMEEICQHGGDCPTECTHLVPNDVLTYREASGSCPYCELDYSNSLLETANQQWTRFAEDLKSEVTRHAVTEQSNKYLGERLVRYEKALQAIASFYDTPLYSNLVEIASAALEEDGNNE